MDKELLKQLTPRFGAGSLDELPCERLAALYDSVADRPSPYGGMGTIYDESNEDERTDLRDTLLKCLEEGVEVEIYHVQDEGVKTDATEDSFDFMERHSCWYRVTS